ncbi:MAG TPA: HEAT repeat domain-containing protein [Gemmatimonadaceae bacterium]|nr:HEAT repeat domain-containing protein [Gemmatimonadaceae bacterium]
MRPRHVGIVLCAAAGLFSVPVIAWSARPSSAIPSRPVQREVPDDTAALSRLLTSVRGANPLFCELATRMIDGRNYWSSGGRDALVEMDASASAMIRWVHTRHEDPRFVPRLIPALRDSDPCVRRVAGGMLGRVAHPSARTALLAALDDAGAGTREVAAIGLGLQEDTAAVQPLVARLRDASADVRRTAAWALGHIEHKSAMMPLVELLGRDPDPRVREAAAWAIGQVTGN